MEDDRDEVNVGTAVDVLLAAEAATPPVRQPKRRFVGRRAAAELAEKRIVDLPATIEDGAIQGFYRAVNEGRSIPLTSI